MSWKSRSLRQLHLAQKVYMLKMHSEISNLKLFIFFHPQSGECHRGPRGQRDPRKPLAPSTHHPHSRHTQPDPKHGQFGLPPFLPMSSGFGKTSSFTLYSPSFEVKVQPPSYTVHILGSILGQMRAISPQRNSPARPPPTVKANTIPETIAE